MKTGLLQTLRADHILCSIKVSNWQEAVEVTGKFMQHAGFCTNQFTQAMFDLIEQHGPYMVIAPGIALLHASPGDYILQSGLVLITLEQPVSFGHSENDPVWLIIGLADLNDRSHVNALSELAILLSVEGMLDRIYQSSNNSKNLFDLIRSSILEIEE